MLFPCPGGQSHKYMPCHEKFTTANYSDTLVTFFANWKAKVTAKAAVNQMCLKCRLFLLGNLTHLQYLPKAKAV